MQLPLLPTLKEKKRYLAFEIITPSAVPFSAAATAITQTTSSFLGTLGMANIGMNILPDNYDSNKGLIRVSHTGVNHLKASLALITEISGKPAIVKSLGASGILQKARNKYVKGGD